MALGRSRRRCWWSTRASPRNAPAGHVHNYLGREGDAARASCWRSAAPRSAQYGVRGGRTVAWPPCARWDRPGTGFVVDLDGRPRGRARGGCWWPPGSSTSCPTCPGWPSGGAATCCTARTATAGRCATGAIVVLATSRHGRAPGAAVPPAQRRRRHGARRRRSEPPEDDSERLAARGVGVRDGDPPEVDGRRRRARGVRLRDGRRCSSATPSWSSPRLHGAGRLPGAARPRAGAGRGDRARLLGSVIPADPTGATAVPGVWVGRQRRRRHGPGRHRSAAAGLRAGAVVNADLVAEDARRTRWPRTARRPVRGAGVGGAVRGERRGLERRGRTPSSPPRPPT